MTRHIRESNPVSRLAKRVRWVMRRVSYKQGYGMAMQETKNELYFYIYTDDTPDADGGADIGRVRGQRWHIRDRSFEEDILHIIWHAIERFEIHEVRDWLRFEGKKLIDEHGSWTHR